MVLHHRKIHLKLTKQLENMLSYLAEKSSVGVKFRCGLSQKLLSVTKDVLLFFPFLHAASLCGDNDNFILMLPSQDGCGQQLGLRIDYLGQKKKKKGGGDMPFQKKPLGVVLLDSLRSCAYPKPIRWP